ncbi:MAG: Asp/Glu/hydantoin racemase [Chloroflexi bacterium]|nr:Asp/Glu/hydantoin racemase [Chloroflexota bacterium]
MVAARRIGMITPSSNTMVEPLTSAMTAGLLDDLSVHYARIPVTRIALDQGSLDQFEREAMLSAARLLADAKVDVICWNGTSGAWKGVEADRALCAAITEETGIPATTGTLAQFEAFRAHGITQYAMAVPYTRDVHDAIVRVYGDAGFACVNSAYLGISTNFAFAEVGLDTLHDLALQADHPDAEAVVVICTNLAAARVVEALEQRLGKPVHDSLVISLWHPLRMLGWDRPIPGWGRLLAEFA